MPLKNPCLCWESLGGLAILKAKICRDCEICAIIQFAEAGTGIVHPPSSMSVCFWILLELEIRNSVSHLSVSVCCNLCFLLSLVGPKSASGLGPWSQLPGPARSPPPMHCKVPSNLRFQKPALRWRSVTPLSEYWRYGHDTVHKLPRKKTERNEPFWKLVKKKNIYIYISLYRHSPRGFFTCLNHPKTGWFFCVAEPSEPANLWGFFQEAGQP